MSTNQNSFRAEEFCSRKLWDLVNSRQEGFTDADLAEAVAELAQRRHYLEQLRELGQPVLLQADIT